jgi:hypothetical protein
MMYQTAAHRFSKHSNGTNNNDQLSLQRCEAS